MEPLLWDGRADSLRIATTTSRLPTDDDRIPGSLASEFLDAFRDTVPTAAVLEWHDGQTNLRVLFGETLAYWLKRYTPGELNRSRELEAVG